MTFKKILTKLALFIVKYGLLTVQNRVNLSQIPIGIVGGSLGNGGGKYLSETGSDGKISHFAPENLKKSKLATQNWSSMMS